MNAPINRDKQIELMKEAEKRHKDLMANWVKNTQVREVLARPAKGQEDAATYYSEEDRKVACCG